MPFLFEECAKKELRQLSYVKRISPLISDRPTSLRYHCKRRIMVAQVLHVRHIESNNFGAFTVWGITAVPSDARTILEEFG